MFSESVADAMAAGRCVNRLCVAHTGHGSWIMTGQPYGSCGGKEMHGFEVCLLLLLFK